MQNISLFNQLILEIQSILEYCDQTRNAYFLTMSTPKIFNQLLIYAKNQAILLICSGDMVD